MPPSENLNHYLSSWFSAAFAPNHQTLSRPFFSITYELPIFYPLCFDIHPSDGGLCTPCGVPVSTRRRSDFRTPFLSTSSPIAAQPPWCHNGHWRNISSPSGETTPPSPVSNCKERTSGTARQRSPLQVVPESTVPKVDRSAGWPAIQQRVGKAGSVRLG
jgi:hypothetical protein